jgi:superfamily II DNA/RNA helicase
MKRVNEVAAKMNENDFAVSAIHSGLETEERTSVMRAFRNR